jgi:hypothetical protein
MTGNSLPDSFDQVHQPAGARRLKSGATMAKSTAVD